jgi:excisionase family DNA binding protein
MESTNKEIPVLMTTSEVARSLGLSEQAVRAWERRGILQATRLGNGQRLFNRADVERVAAVIWGQRHD